VIALKRIRRVAVGPILTVVLENRTTVRFQVQEMARAERMVTDEQIQAELDIYNPLIPGPGELCVTLFVELTSPEQLREWLPKLVGIERSLELRIGADPARRVGGEVESAHEAQLTREEKTASVHYVQFRLTPDEARSFRDGPVSLAARHRNYSHSVELSVATIESIVADWADAGSGTP
jgi:hypothetical protein